MVWIYNNFPKSEIIKSACNSWFCHKRQCFGLSGDRFWYLGVHIDILILFFWLWEVYLSSEISKSSMYEKVIAIQWEAEDSKAQPKPSKKKKKKPSRTDYYILEFRTFHFWNILNSSASRCAHTVTKGLFPFPLSILQA